MLACMISSTVNLIPWIIPKVDWQELGQIEHCNNLLGITTSEDVGKIQNNEILIVCPTYLGNWKDSNGISRNMKNLTPRVNGKFCRVSSSSNYSKLKETMLLTNKRLAQERFWSILIPLWSDTHVDNGTSRLY